MRLPEDHRSKDAIDSLSALRKLAAELCDRIAIGSRVPLPQTTTVEPRTFTFRKLLYEIAPLAKEWGFTISEKSPRFVDLVHAFGLFDTREKTVNAIKNSKKKDGADPDNSILEVSWSICARVASATTNKTA
jgi:hypothetical protein